MNRRNFLKTTLAASLTAGARLTAQTGGKMKAAQIPRRVYKKDVALSILGFGGIVVVQASQAESNDLVAAAVDRGVNYFDVAPSYGDGMAEIKLGIALKPYRQQIFLACKTLARDAAGAQMEFERSLQRLHTSYFDLYQFHAVTTEADVEKIWAPGGAAEFVTQARTEGRIRFLGFSAHSETAARAMLDRFPFDSVLFPINYVLYARGNFGPGLAAYAQQKGVTLLALKSLALRPYRESEAHAYPNCWYYPIHEPQLARQALRFTLSEGVTAIIPPGDPGVYQMALDLSQDLPPLTAAERQELLSSAADLEPLFHR